MPKDLDGCTCWLAPSTNGGVKPSTWLAMHSEVEIHTSDGRCIRGWPLGIEADVEHPLAEWIVEVSGGDLVGIPLDDVITVDPTRSVLSDADMIHQLLNGIANPSEVPTEGLHFDFLVSPHELVEVRLELQRRPCEP